MTDANLTEPRPVVSSGPEPPDLILNLAVAMSSSSDDLGETREVSGRSRKKRNSLLLLAAGMLLFGVAAGTLYYALRPVTLRIAVGPPGSDDQKLIQALAQAFARESVRLAPISTAGTTESIALLGSCKADLAVARGDLAMPANTE